MKYTSLYFITRKDRNWPCVIGTETNDSNLTDGGLLRLTSYLLNRGVSVYSGPYVSASLTGGSQPGTACPPLWTFRIWQTWLPFWLTTDRSVCGYLCIYNFITPTRSFRLSFRFSTHVIYFGWSLVYPAETSCLEIPNRRVYQRSIGNTRMV